MLGRLDDDLVRSHPVHAVEQLAHVAVNFAFDLQGRVLVRNAPDPPPGAVWNSVFPIGEDLGRGHVLVTVAERALQGVRRRCPAAEGPGPLCPRGGEDHPGIRHVVLPEFWHRLPGRSLKHDRLLFQGCAVGFFGDSVRKREPRELRERPKECRRSGRYGTMQHWMLITGRAGYSEQNRI